MEAASEPQPLEPTLLGVANAGTKLVTNVTKYLSTLPHPIEIIEELVAVCSVTSSLLHSLDSTINRFYPATQLPPKAPFIKPLCHDILLAFSQFAQKVCEAQRLRVFEPNDVGLVRVPRNAWAFVMGNEAKMGQLRSRLYVEKYRVRVLIDAVAWQGLRELGRLGRSSEQERELEMLRKMLPLVAERLMGVWKDYKPRIGNGGAAKPVHVAPRVNEQKKEPAVVAVQEERDDLKKDVKVASGKLGIHSSLSTTSIASSWSTRSTSSSATIIDDSIQELWQLRRSEAKRSLTTQTRILGIPLKSTYAYTPAHHYVKPLSSHPSETQSLVTQQIARGSSISKEILKLPDDAQWEIQKLIESRQNASSNEHTKRSWEVVAFQARPRRQISPSVSGDKKWWKGRGKKQLVEWVLVLKGETVDHKARTTPIKYEDPWNPKPKQVSKPAVGAQPVPIQIPAPVPQQVVAAQLAARAAPGAHVLRHVEQKRGLSPQEAEAKMVEFLGDLLRCEHSDAKSDVGEKQNTAAITAKYTSN